MPIDPSHPRAAEVNDLLAACKQAQGEFYKACATGDVNDAKRRKEIHRDRCTRLYHLLDACTTDSAHDNGATHE